MTKFTVGLVQPNAIDDMAANIAFVEEQTRRARDKGAAFVMTPENAVFMTLGRDRTLAAAPAEAAHPALAAFRALAKETGTWFLAGSLHVRVSEQQAANRSYLIDPQGVVVASYDKIHMFDVQLKGGENYRESSTFRPGARAVVAETPWGKLGMTICYDLRFPHLYRSLAQAGASMLTIPSAFTRPTGMAHWHVLMRARAIETGCWVFAPAQTGDHPLGRKTYGHSVVIAPWGETIADAGEAPGFVTAEVDMAKVEEARSMVPSLTHDRAFAGPEFAAADAPKMAAE